MSSDEVMQIKVGGDRIGIIGLKSILSKVAETCAAQSDEEIRTEIAEIGSYGVMGTPALVINREVKAVGSVPPKPKLKKWLQDAFAQTAR